MAGIVASCAVATCTDVQGPVVASLSVTPSLATLSALGDTTRFRVVALDERARTFDASGARWSSSAPAVATIDSLSGLARAVGNGMSQIAVRIGDAQSSAGLTVSQVPARVRVTKPSGPLTALGDTTHLAVAIEDSRGNPIAGRLAWWSSDAPAVVIVDSASGLVTAAGNGVGTVRAHADTATGAASVLVTQVVASVEAALPRGTLNALGDTTTGHATPLDQRGNPVPGKPARWASSNESVASVDSASGFVTARRDGSALITAAIDAAVGQVTITVRQTPATLAFTIQPGDAVSGAALAPTVQVAIQDALRNTVTSATAAVTVAFASNPRGGTLSGPTTASAVGGVAGFADLSIDRAASGYTLLASSDGLASATSAAFTIAPAVTTVLSPAGGTYEFANGVVLTVPAGAVSAPTAATLGPLHSDLGALFSAQFFASHQKRVMGGFAAEPHGLRFSTPITAEIPVTPLTSPSSIPMTVEVSPTGDHYWLGTSPLEYDSAAGVVRCTLASFSGHAVAELSPKSAGSGQEAPCRSRRIAVVVQEADFSGGVGGTCQIVSSAVSVTFHDCPGSPTETDLVSEATPQCGSSVSLAVSIAPPSATLRPGQTDRLVATTVATGGTIRGSVPIVWHTSDASIVAVNAATGDITGGREGVATIRVEALDPRYYAEASVEVSGVGIVRGRVWLDDGDGQYTGVPTDQPLAGVLITLSGPETAVSTTAPDGTYLFGRLVDGVFQVSCGSCGSSTLGDWNQASAQATIANGGEWTADFYTVPAPASLAFTVQPSATAAGHRITPAVQIAIRSAAGTTIAAATTSVTIAIGTNPENGTLASTATVNALNGVASFSTLSIDNPGIGYTLTASASGLTGATSAAFDVTGFSSVSSGSEHTCGLVASGVAYCWGYPNRSSSTPVAVATGLTFAAVTAGAYHNCALTTDGTAYCWGANARGELGNGSTTDSYTPVAVAGGLTFATLSAGYDHTCGLTIGRTAYCWGYNGAGQLGSGSTTDSYTPVAVAGGLTFAEISAGGSPGYTCGRTASGAVYCWGFNQQGQLGNDATSFGDSIPVAVVGGPFAAVSTGGSHTCGLTFGGAAYCWGSNFDGELGDGSASASPVPVAVSAGLTFVAVTAGNDHTCGLTTGSAVYCWGNNQVGELGNGSTSESHVPAIVSGGLTFAMVSAGKYHNTCAVTTSGAAYCWGWFFSLTPVRISNP